MGRDFRGGSGGYSRGGSGGFSRGGGRGRGDSRGGRFQDQGPPQRVEPLAQFSHVCGNQIVLKSLTKTQVPKFFRPVYFENKQQIGKVDEIFGQIDNYLYSVNLDEGIEPTSFKEGQKIYLNPYDCLGMEKFLPRPKGAPREPGQSRGRGGGRGGARGGRGGPSRGFSRGNSRGGPPRGGSGRGSFRGGDRGGQRFGRGGFKQ